MSKEARTHRENEINEAMASKAASMQSEAARQLCNTIKVNLLRHYKCQVFWYTNKRSDTPDKPLEKKTTAIGLGFPFKRRN